VDSSVREDDVPQPVDSMRFARPPLVAAAALLLALSSAVHAAPSVLLVGDSWARQMFDDGALESALAAAGHPEVAVLGDATSISGSTAQEWANATMLELLTDELAAHPETEAVVLFLGGNDLLAGESGGGWYVGISPAAETALFDTIESDLATIVDAALAADPDVEVVLTSYDYPNFVETLSGLGAFVCVPLWQDLGEPTPFEINTTTALLDERQAAIAATRPRVATVSHWGLMQVVFGYPSLGIDPGDLALPGDPTLPSPPQAMRLFGSDCFHLRASGYTEIAGRLWDEALERIVLGIFADGFESGLGAWSDSVGGS
jgi:lysophospholipase L1-like esterase